MADKMSLLDILTRFVLPPILGGAGGFLTVYANWGIEKRRARQAQRREHIATWRKELLPLLRPDLAFTPEVRSQFMATGAFASLEPHPSRELMTKIRGDTVYVGGNFPRRELVAEIGRLEKRWGLV
jgi:hypothetical protein